MSEATVETGVADTATTDAPKVAKPKTEYTQVKLNDGREVQFAGNRKLNREVLTDEGGNAVGVRFDYANGETRTLLISDLDEKTQRLLLAHGISQKVGDEGSAAKGIVEDMVEAHDNMIERLKKGEFYTSRGAGDSFAGASFVIRAIMEVTGKSHDEVKAFINKKLESAAAKGEKLTRAELYASFRNPESKTGQIIARLEREKAAKEQKFNADDLIAEAMETVA